MAAILPRIDFYSAHDDRRLAVRVWNAAQAPKARVVFLHGITSHGGWYDQSAAYLAAAGYEVAFIDRRGSGLNGEEMGDVANWQAWIEDVETFVGADRQPFANSDSLKQSPTILCGISWGGKLAAAIARHSPGLFAGVALVCPGIYSPYMPGVLKRLALATPAPKWLRQRRLRVPLRRTELFTDTPRWCDFIDRDPLALRTLTWRFAQQDRELTRYAREAAAFLHLPTLVMLADQDRIVDNRRTREYFGRFPSRQKALIEYHGAAHTLEFEPDPTQYFRDLVEWVERIVEARKI